MVKLQTAKKKVHLSIVELLYGSWDRLNPDVGDPSPSQNVL